MQRIMTVPLVAGALLLTAMSHRGVSDDLLQFVHRDVAACLHVPRPVADWDRIQSSKFADRITASAVFREWQKSPEYQNLGNVRSLIESVLGKPLPEAAEELVGSGFVVAAYVTPGGEPDGLLLFEADSEAAVRNLLMKLKGLTDPQTEQKTHRDTVYDRWITKDGVTTHFVRSGNVLALAESEALIRQVIDLRLDNDVDATLAQKEELLTALKRRHDSEVAAVYINPRAWDSHVTADDETPKPLKNAWKRCRWITVRLRYQDAPQVDVEADYDNSGAPEWWTRWVDMARSTQLPVERIPDNALMAMSGLLESPGLSDLAGRARPPGQELPKEIRQVRRVLNGLLLGLDPVNDLLPKLGPRWMAYVVPRDMNAADAIAKTFPVDMLFAIELQDLETGSDPDSDPEAGLHNTLVTGLNVLTAVHNTRTSQQVAVVRQKDVDGVTVRWAEPVALFRPAYAIADGYLLLASSPDLCEQFLAERTRRTSPVAELGNNLQFLFANSVAARTLLTTHEAWFMWRASRDNVPEDEAAKRLEKLDGFLQMLDGVWVSTALDENLIRMSAGVSVDADAGE